MLDFNHRATFVEKLNEHIDQALQQSRALEQERDYLGASRLGVSCLRALQYEFMNAPKDKEFSGKILRVFEIGHTIERLMIGWLRQAGLVIETHDDDLNPFGFSTASGRVRGHVDGIITSAPENLGMKFPAIWECKSLNAKSWRDLVNNGLKKSKPIYATQVAVYQAYMEERFPGISGNPALFTALNKDTAEIHHLLVEFDQELAQAASDRAVHILKATDAQESLPRITSDEDYFECRFCDYRNTCWST